MTESTIAFSGRTRAVHHNPDRSGSSLKSATQVLKALLQTPEFSASHSTAVTDPLFRFLTATLDEVRLHHAILAADSILENTDLRDLQHFRHGVLRRELGRQISFERQRDHSAHTINLYLLGGLFFQHVPEVRLAILSQMANRGLNQAPTDFYCIWVFASLLHDIGYIFEGATRPLDVSHFSERSSIGIDITQEYFDHYMWVVAGANSLPVREHILFQAGIEPFRFSGTGFAGIVSSLRNAGSVETLMKGVNMRRTLSRLSSLPWNPAWQMGDTFELWQEHYRNSEAHKMEPWVSALEEFAHDGIYQGLASTGIRVLDHGVCSGLLCALISTYWFRIMMGLYQTPYSGLLPCTQRFIVANASGTSLATTDWDPAWWWGGALWGTAAAALHNFVQTKTPLRPGLLAITDDALTFLGVLCDILQEWDRFRVTPAFPTGEIPAQGSDVRIMLRNNRVVVHFSSRDLATRVSRALDDCLSGWQSIVSVR